MSRNNNSSTTSTGLGFTGALQIMFIALKLCKVIDWSWWCVMLPTIIPVGLAVLIIAVAFIIAFMKD